MPLDTELHKAAHKGDIQGVKDLVQSGEIHVNEKGAQDRTALHRAAGANHVSIIQFLLQAGAPVDCVDRCRRTPLHWAAISGHLDATQLLLDSGGDLRCKTMSGMNPLMCAVQQQWHSVAEAILEWSAGCAEEVENGRTPSPAELCSTTDAEGKTAFVFAKEHGDVSMQKLLKPFAPKKPSSSCCGGGKELLAAAVVPPGDLAAGDGATAGAGTATATTSVSDTDAGTTATDGDDGVGGGWLSGLCCFGRCCRTSSGDSCPSGAPLGATVTDAAPPSSASSQTTAVKGSPIGKVDGSRSSTASTPAGIGGVQSIMASSANTNTNTCSSLPQLAGEDVSTRGADAGAGGIDGSGAGTLAMNSPASDNTKRFSSSSSSLQSALRPVENASLQDSRSRTDSVRKDNRSSCPGMGGDGARKSSRSSYRRRREGHAGSGGDERGSSEGSQAERRSRKSRSGGGSGGDPSRGRRKHEREGRRSSRRAGGDGGGAGTVTGAARTEGSEGSEQGTVTERDTALAAATPFVQLNGNHEDGVRVGFQDLAPQELSGDEGVDGAPLVAEADVAEVVEVEELTKEEPRHAHIEMPSITEAEKVATLTSWNVQVGDVIKVGDVVCEIELEQFSVGVKVETPGYLAEILVEAGTEGVPVGADIGTIVHSEEDIAVYQRAQVTASKEQEVAPDPVETFSWKNVLKDVLRLRQEDKLSEDDASVLMSLARNKDSELLQAFEGCFEGDTYKGEIDDDLFLAQSRRKG
eukprot:g14341.t2